MAAARLGACVTLKLMQVTCTECSRCCKIVSVEDDVGKPDAFRVDTATGLGVGLVFGGQ